MVSKLLEGMLKIANQLDLEFQYSPARYNIETGVPLEIALRHLYRPYFPMKFGFSSGYIVDLDGNISTQSDWIIYDAINQAPIISNTINTGIEWIPFEGVYSTIEVKRTLNSDALSKAIEQLRKTKELIREDNYGTSINPITAIQSSSRMITNRMINGIFAYNSSKEDDLNPASLLEQITNGKFGSEYDLLPDFIAIHNEYFLLKVCLLQNERKGIRWRFDHLIVEKNNGFAWIDSKKYTAGLFYYNLISCFSIMSLKTTYQLDLIRKVMNEMDEDLMNNGELFLGKKYIDDWTPSNK